MAEAYNYNDRHVDSPRFGKKIVRAALRELNLPRKSYVVVGGTGLLLRGLRTDVQDIDLLVDITTLHTFLDTPAVRAHVQRKDYESGYSATNTTVHFDTSTGVPVSATTHMDGAGRHPLNFAPVRAVADVVLGVPCITLAEQVASKTALGRPKDIIDLQNIRRAELDGRI